MNKTIHYLKTIVLSLVAVLAMASCTDDDTQQAYDLDGYWQGSIMGSYYADRFHSSDNWDTEIWFVQDGDFSSGGYGLVMTTVQMGKMRLHHAHGCARLRCGQSAT